MGKGQCLENFNSIFAPVANRGRVPFANPIEREDRCLRKRGWKKRAGCVRFMMTGESNPFAVTVIERLSDFSRQMKLGFEPERNGRHERGQAGWSVSQISLQ